MRYHSQIVPLLCQPSSHISLRNLSLTLSPTVPATMSPNWKRLIRFIAEEDGQVHLGEVDGEPHADIGLAAFNGEKIAAKLVQGSIFDGLVTTKKMHVARVRCSPLTLLRL